MINKGLFDYLDQKEAVEIEQKGGVKIEVASLNAEGVQELVAKIMRDEGFEELKIKNRINMCFVNTARLQILQIEFLGITERMPVFGILVGPIFRITLKEFSEKEKYQQEMEAKIFMFTNEEIMLFFEVVRKGKVNPNSHGYSTKVEESLVIAEMLQFDADGHLILGDLGSDYLATFGNSIPMQSLFQGQGG